MILDSNIIIESSKNYLIVEEFLKNNFSSPTHWPNWNILVSKYFHTDFLYSLAFSGIELIGICPLHKITNGALSNFYSGQFHFIPNGGGYSVNRQK